MLTFELTQAQYDSNFSSMNFHGEKANIIIIDANEKEVGVINVGTTGISTPIVSTPLEYASFGWNANFAGSGEIFDVLPDKVFYSVGIPLSNGVFTLKGGKTYKIDMDISCGYMNSGTTYFILVGATTNVQIPNTAECMTNSYGASHNGACIIKPSEDTAIKIRTLGSAGSASVFSHRSRVNIQEVK